MPKIELISSDEDDDIWDYRSQTQKAKNIQNHVDSKSSKSSNFQRKKQQSKHQEKSGSSLSQKRVKTEEGVSIKINKSQKQKKAAGKKKIKVKLELKKECTPNVKKDTDRSGRCPVCQMPFTLLSLIETPSWHIDQCLDVPYSSKNECPAGLECDSEISNHYKKFRHTCIARSRRKNEITNKDKGNVEGAKTKLSFDDGTDDRKLVLPGTSSDCIIILDSSQDSDFSQRPSNDVEDEDLSSPGDKTKGEKRCIDSINGTRLNNYHNGACQDLEKKLFGTNSEDEEQMFGDHFENDNAELEGMNSNVELVSVSDNSCGSVQDIDALVDDTRSIADMIQDALAQDDVDDSEASEVFTDNMNITGNKKNNVTSTTQCGNEGYELDEEKDALLDGEQSYKDNGNDEEEDDLISLFTDRSGKKALDKSSKESSIPALRKSPEKSQGSSSSSDWEILKTTLTQPLFGDDVRDMTDGKVEPEEHAALPYAASHRTPTKSSENAVARHHIHNTEAKEINYFEGSKEKNVSKMGFFATKMLQLATKNKSDSDKTAKCDDDQPGYDQEEKSIKETVTKEKSCSKENVSKGKLKSSYLKRKATTHLVSDSDKASHESALLEESSNQKSTKLEEVGNQSENTTNTPVGQIKPDNEAKLTAVNVEMNRIETIEKKPKIELKPKTPLKRKKGRKDQNQVIGSKTENKNSGNVKLESFFKPKKDRKSMQVFVQTDSESSGDCERFNKIGRFVKCCEKCTEKNSSKPNFLSTTGEVIDISNSGDNNSRHLDTEKMNARRTSNLSLKCSQGVCDIDSDFFSGSTSCQGVGSSQNSIKLTVSGNCQNSCQLGKNKSHSQNNTIKDSEYSCHGHCSHCAQQNQDLSCFHHNHCQGCFHEAQNSQGQSCSHKSQDQSSSSKELGQTCSMQNQSSSCQSQGQSCSHKSQDQSFSSKELGQTCSMPNQSSSCQSQGQSCSHKSQGQSFSSNSLGQSYSLQGQSCSHGSHSQSCSNQSQGDCGSQHYSHRESCKSSNRTCSQNTLQFNIENVCTLSQNTYSKLGGGFITGSDENSNNLVDIPHSSNQTSDIPSALCSNTGSSASTSSYLSETDVENILQIRKSATEILMASSRLLYKKSLKKSSSATSGSQNSGEMPVEMGTDHRKGFTRNRRFNTTSSETSDEAKVVKRKCPFYKKIPDTCMTVDAFKYGNIPDCKAYILSHFHYDHYMGLNKHFKNPIYCSKITGNLVKKKIGVDTQYINSIALNTPTVVENVEITFLEANHCPGAVLILFKLMSGKVFLHTGDFRANQEMEIYPPLLNVKIHSLYLDTTYCDPQYDFPAQEEVIKFTVQLVLDALASNSKTLIVCGTYTIGKERIFTAIAEELDCKICVTRDKKSVLDCMEDEGLKRRVSLNWEDSRLHVLPMNKVNYNGLQEHLLLNGKKYNSVLGIEPTGWTHNKKVLSLHHIKPKVNKDNIKIYGVPYSEHSSFLELKRFVQFTRPAKILPTVNNGNVHSRRKMEVIFEAWMKDAGTDKSSVVRQCSIAGWTK